MRIFHIAILTYCFLCIGCGFKAIPVWRDAPQGQSQSMQEAQMSAIKK